MTLWISTVENKTKSHKILPTYLQHRVFENMYNRQSGLYLYKLTFSLHIARQFGISKNIPLKVEDFDDNPWAVQDVSGMDSCGI